MGFQIRRPQVVLPASLLVVAMIALVVGATVNAITADNDTEPSSRPRAPVPRR